MGPLRDPKYGQGKVLMGVQGAKASEAPELLLFFFFFRFLRVKRNHEISLINVAPVNICSIFAFFKRKYF